MRAIRPPRDYRAPSQHKRSATLRFSPITHRNAIALANADDRRINVGGAGLESAVGVGNGAPGVVVQMHLNVAVDNAAERPDEVVDLTRRRAAHGVGDADAVDADLVDGTVERKEIDEIGTERVLGREPDLDALGLDKLNHFYGALGDVRHVLAVGEFA